MLSILSTISHQVMGKIKQVTDNRTKQTQSMFVPKGSPEDTVLIVLLLVKKGLI